MQIIIALSILALVGIDQLTKYWAVAALKGQEQIKLWDGVLHLAYVENKGAAFGMLQDKQWFFVLVAIAAVIVIYIYWKQIPNNRSGKWAKFALILIVSGAIGNVIDRIVLGYVVDMIYFALIDFPVFNVADICVVVGTAILMPVFIFGDIEPDEAGNTN